MLITLLDWWERMLIVNKKSHVIGYVMILRIFGTSKSYVFGKITKRCLIDPIPWVWLMEVVMWGSHIRWLWKWVSLKWPRVRGSDGEKGKLTLWSFKYESQLIIRLKAIKSIKELLCSLSFYINLQSSNFCSPKPHCDDGGIWFDGRLFDEIRLVIIAIAIDLTFIGLINPWGNSLHS